MNWVGGARRRVGLLNEKKTQKEYFERKRQHKKIRAFQSPNKKYGISQDLLALHTVNTAYSGMTFDKRIPEKRLIRKVNIDQNKRFTREIQEVVLPHSPIMTPSKLTFEETDLSAGIIPKPPRLNTSSAETSISNYGKTRTNDSLLPHPFSSTPNYSARDAHQHNLGNLFNTPVSAIDICKTPRIMDHHQTSFLPSLEMYPRMSQEPTTPLPALPEEGHIPMAHISDVYNKTKSNWKEHRKSVHTATYIEERQHCWQVATSQRSYISKKTSPFITTLHEFQESQPYSCDNYQQASCPKSPAEYIAIPLGSASQFHMPRGQGEKLRQGMPTEKTHNRFSIQMSNETSDFWQIPVYGDFVKEMKIKRSQLDNLVSTGQSTKTKTEEEIFSTKYCREKIKEENETSLMTMPSYNEDEEDPDPGFSNSSSCQMNPESRITSNLVDVSVQADLKRSVKDSSTSPLFLSQKHQQTQCDTELFNLDLSEDECKDSLPDAPTESGCKVLLGTSKNLVNSYQLRSKSTAKFTGEK